MENVNVKELSDEQMDLMMEAMRKEKAERDRKIAYDCYLTEFNKEKEKKINEYHLNLQSVVEDTIEKYALKKGKGKNTLTITQEQFQNLCSEYVAPEKVSELPPATYEDFRKPKSITQPARKKSTTSKSSTGKKAKTTKDPDQKYTGEAVCLCRKGSGFCGAVGSWLCEEHQAQYETNRKLKNGWWGCFGDNHYGKGSFGKSHDKYMAPKIENAETKDNRPQECIAQYPLE